VEFDTRTTKIVEAHGREIGRIHKVWNPDGTYRGSFFTLTKYVPLPAGKIQNYGINWRYML